MREIVNFYTEKSCLALNGIQEVSGSIPLISTKGKQSPKGGCFFVDAVNPLSADRWPLPLGT